MGAALPSPDRSRDRAAIVSGYIPMRLTWMQLRDEPLPITPDGLEGTWPRVAYTNVPGFT